MKLENWMLSKNLNEILNQDYDLIKPITAEFVTTLNCNFSCTQCAYKPAKENNSVWKKTSKKSNIQMTEEVMELSLERLAEGGVKNILITGGGEPLITPVTLKTMAKANELNLTHALYTNGFLLTKRITEEIISLDPLFTRISIYGGNQRTMNQYTQTKSMKSFDSLIEKIDNIAKVKKEANSSMNLGLSYLVHPITANSVLEFAHRIRELTNIDNINYIRFTPAVDYFGGQQHSKELMNDVFEVVNGIIKPLFEDINTEIKPYMHRVNDLHGGEKL
ncbi:MAG: radical SAM protein [SAR202 cluster bacterium]|jgi:sulfatase maturation enzyme AslB (radical SAM superfamily)|nr:radical SAM protein [SAR202 cluster bacterium]